MPDPLKKITSQFREARRFEIMSLTWTDDMREKAKAEEKALVKLQVQMKHAKGGNYRIAGTFPPDHARALFLLGSLPQEDTHKISKILEILK